MIECFLSFAASQTIGFHEPKDMLQVLSLSLSLTESCPISVYGIFAIRDDLHPLRNYVFNRTREDSVMIEEVQVQLCFLYVKLRVCFIRSVVPAPQLMHVTEFRLCLESPTNKI